jgi:hypothetical protein
MSAASQALLTIAAKQLSADGATVRRGEDDFASDLSGAAAGAVLRAFAAVPTMELVEVDAKIYLTGPQAKVAVQNVGGRLFATIVPEAVNTATERTPEQIVAIVTTGKAGAAKAETSEAEAVREEEALAAVKRDARGWRGALRSPWTLVALVLIGLGWGYANYVPATPAGVEVIRDPAKIATLHRKLNGRYGVPAATVLVLNSGKLTGVKMGPASATEVTVFELSYRFGLRGEQPVMLVSNGALLEQQPGGALKFLESVYPRIAQ